MWQKKSKLTCILVVGSFSFILREDSALFLFSSLSSDPCGGVAVDPTTAGAGLELILN